LTFLHAKYVIFLAARFHISIRRPEESQKCANPNATAVSDLEELFHFEELFPV